MNAYLMPGVVLGVSSAVVSVKNKWARPSPLGGSLDSATSEGTDK